MALESWVSVIPGLQNSSLADSLMGKPWETGETERRAPKAWSSFHEVRGSRPCSILCSPSASQPLWLLPKILPLWG